MSALPPKADIAERDWHVRFVPKADIERALRSDCDWPKASSAQPKRSANSITAHGLTAKRSPERLPNFASTAISKQDLEISAPHCARAGSEEIRRLRASVASSFAGCGSFR